MRRSLTVRRTVQELPNGEHRWDRAYQLLLRWAQDAHIERAARDVAPADLTQEVSDESSGVRTRIDTAAGSDPIH